MVAALGALGAVPVAAAAVPPVATDRRMYWSGWRQAVNQDVWFGWWVAAVERDAGGYDRVVSTTGGRVHRSRDGNVVEGGHDRGWPMLTGRATEVEKAAVQERARQALLVALKDGTVA